MTRRFNDTGICIPKRHFMVDISQKIEKITTLVDDGNYFVINKPRQFGKTTTLFQLTNKLVDDGYKVFNISFEGIGDKTFEDETRFCVLFLELLVDYIEKGKPHVAEILQNYIKACNSIKSLSNAISDFCFYTSKPVVLIIDEEDKAANNKLLHVFLGMLRSKYMDMLKGTDKTFHSVILAGVHDIKTLGQKVPDSAGQKLNSPWNIAIDFNVEMTFDSKEIATMLMDYSSVKKVEMDIVSISDHLHYYTEGYPFLVSKLCKLIDEIILPEKKTKTWTTEDVDKSFQLLTSENYTTTIFDDQIKNIENYPKIFQLLVDVLINGEKISLNRNETTIELAINFGLLSEKSKICTLHNIVFKNRIYNYLLAYKRINKASY